MVGVGTVWYVVKSGGRSDANAPTKMPHQQAKLPFVGTAEEIEQHRAKKIAKFLDDFKTLHSDPSRSDRKLMDDAEPYVNDRIAQDGETWRFDKVTGKPAL